MSETLYRQNILGLEFYFLRLRSFYYGLSRTPIEWLTRESNNSVIFTRLSLKLMIILYIHITTWRPPSLSELTPMIFNMGLIHLG